MSIMCTSRRGSPSPSTSYSFACTSDDEDAIMPAPPAQPQQQQPQPLSTRRTSTASRLFDPLEGLEGEGTDTELLWHRMLAIQRVFGCYNSARMRAALDTGLEDGFIPSKACLDLLNDSLIQLPDHDRRRLDEYLRNEVRRKAKRGRGMSKRLWSA